MTKFCPECGTQQRDDNVKYCSNCGFDFSKIENKKVSQGINPESIKIDISGSDDSNRSSPKVSAAGNNNVSSSKVSAASNNDSNRSPSSSQINKNGNSGLLSNLSFNKCFLAFALLLILLTVIGMLVQTTETQPSSDYGLTSFMESSGGYDLNSFIDDSDSYDDSDSDSNYLSYNILSVQKKADFL